MLGRQHGQSSELGATRSWRSPTCARGVENGCGKDAAEDCRGWFSTRQGTGRIQKLAWRRKDTAEPHQGNAGDT